MPFDRSGNGYYLNMGEDVYIKFRTETKVEEKEITDKKTGKTRTKRYFGDTVFKHISKKAEFVENGFSKKVVVCHKFTSGKNANCPWCSEFPQVPEHKIPVEVCPEVDGTFVNTILSAPAGMNYALDTATRAIEKDGGDWRGYIYKITKAKDTKGRVTFLVKTYGMAANEESTPNKFTIEAAEANQLKQLAKIAYKMGGFDKEKFVSFLTDDDYGWSSADAILAVDLTYNKSEATLDRKKIDGLVV